MTISRADPPTVLLENGSMVHNQTNADRLWKLKAKMERNRSTHHVPNAKLQENK